MADDQSNENAHHSSNEGVPIKRDSENWENVFSFCAYSEMEISKLVLVLRFNLNNIFASQVAIDGG